MFTLGTSLVVLAKNGVWSVSGDDQGGFSAISQRVDMVSQYGCEASTSVVVAGDVAFYWGLDGIYQIGRDQFGDLKVENLLIGKLQNFYFDLTVNQVRNCSGHFDQFARKVRWLYSDGVGVESTSNELVFFPQASAFTVNKINTQSNLLPQVLSMSEANSFLESSQTEEVTVGGAEVTVSGVVITTEESVRNGAIKDFVSVVITSISPTIEYTFGSYSDTGFLDWSSTGTPVDSGVFLETGFANSQLLSKHKDVDYLHAFFEKTETGFDEDFNAIGESSCLVSSKWNWSNSSSSNKWSPPRQAYRHRRPYTPLDVNDTFDDGLTLVRSRNKVRGSGDSVAFRFEGESGKDLRITGWSYNMFSNHRD